MTSISVKTSGPDRPRRALQILAEAGGAGATTPEIAFVAGEGALVDGQIVSGKGVLSWYGADLRKAEARGWVTRIGLEPGGWQKGRAIRWQITPAGIGRLGEYERARSEPTTRMVAAEKRAKVAERQQIRDKVLDAARNIGPRTLSDERKLELAKQLRDAGCTLQEIADVWAKSREWIRLVLYFDTWHVTAEMMTALKQDKALIAHTRLSQDLEEMERNHEPVPGSG